MKFIRTRRNRFIAFLLVCLIVMLVSYIRTFFILPGEITLLEGEEYVYDFKSPFLVNIKADKLGVLKLNDGEIGKEGSLQRLSSPMLFKTLANGSVKLSMSIFGLIPLRTLQVDVVPNKKIVACGSTIGVKLKIDGILIIGISDVENSEGKKILPTKLSGMKIGDLIKEVNNKKVNSIEEMIKEIEKYQGGDISLKYKRGNSYYSVELKPVKSVDDKRYHLGLWVRESTAGIGTLTFYDPDTNYFGALGHGITDIDTGALMPVKTGELLESRILAIKKGKSGVPGELRGVFIEDKNKLGIINMNCEYGIYGKLNSGSTNKLTQRLYPVAIRSQIKEGAATILSNIYGKKVEEYDIDILKVSRQNADGSKGMVIKVTDKRLLEATGGIVQGMSGSPIIQGGKIIGAVTHVLINDSSRGYGIFIETMLKTMERENQKTLQTAG